MVSDAPLKTAVDSFDAWRTELLLVGNIVQDEDDSVPWPDREARFNRYVAMVDAVSGEEGVATAAALIQSVQARHDYGAYQATHHALGRFPSDVYVAALLQELPALIQRSRDWAGELLCGLANSVGTRFASQIGEFRRQLDAAPSKIRETVVRFIKSEEEAGWLRHRRGVLAP